MCVSVGCEGDIFPEKEQQAHRNSSMGPRAGWDGTWGNCMACLEDPGKVDYSQVFAQGLGEEKHT